MKLGELTQAAMLGTERKAVSVKGGGSALEELQEQLNWEEREKAFLAAAALTAVHERVGALPVRDSGSLHEAAGTETQRRMSGRAGSLLRRILEGDHPQLLPECLGLMAGAGQIALPELLPGLLGIGVARGELREAILPVLGERGVWLAKQNGDWAWAIGAAEDEAVWQTGERAARILFLRRLRRNDPAKAAELLASTWKEETPEDRAAFIAEFRTGLSGADEAFLEAALDDKKKDVRKAAAGLLTLLPESALVRRMIERARGLLKFTPAGALDSKGKKAKKATLEVSLPDDSDKAMQRDGIDGNPPEGIGKKAWWLLQIVASVPLGFWETEWKMSAAEVLKISESVEYKGELQAAWTRAAIHQQNDNWAEVLFPAAMKRERADRTEGLLAAMTPSQREGCVLAVLPKTSKENRHMNGTILTQCLHAWSGEFSRAVLKYLRSETAHESYDWVLRNQLKDLAPQLAPEVLKEAPEGWPTESKGWEFWAKGVDEFLAVAQFRADLRDAFSSK